MTKSIGDKVLGWFIVDEGAGEDAPDAPEAERMSPPPPPARPPVARGLVPDEERDRLDKVIGLIESLPAEANVDVKRAIVGASLEAFGVPIDRILLAAEGALAELDARVAVGQQRTQDALAESDVRIAKLTSEIAELRHGMEARTLAQQEAVRATAAEKARIRVALDFFGAADASGRGLRLVG